MDVVKDIVSRRSSIGRFAHNLSAPGAINIYIKIYMTIAVYVQMMSQQSCKLCNNSSRGRVTSYPVLTEHVLHL